MAAEESSEPDSPGPEATTELDVPSDSGTSAVADPDADRISFEDALSPRRGAISAGTPSLDESEAKSRSAPPR